MIDFELSVDVLGNTRFAYSPLGELTASVRLLGTPQVAHPHRPWLREVRPRLQEVDLALLFAAAPPGRWIADCLVPPSASPAVSIDDQLQDLARHDPEQLAHDLHLAYDRELPKVLRAMIAAGPAGLERLADQCATYWQVAIHPYWHRMCAVLEDDVMHRATRSLSGGLFELLTELHPEVSLNGNVLSIDKPHHRSARYAGADFTLTPSIFVWPHLMVAHSRPGKFELTYPARGVGRTWDGLIEDPVSDSDPLCALLGRSRAAILHLLSVPMSTTQLARMLDQSAGSVSQHLSILRDSGMVASSRSGRSVLYRRTPLATTILSATTRSATARTSGHHRA